MNAALLRVVHGLMLVVSLVPMLLAFFSIMVFVAIAVLADRVQPDARFGNCWTYAAARWGRHGGYVPMRQVDGSTLFGIPIPHALWTANLGGPVRMTYPLKRYEGWFPIYALLFRFDVYYADTPRDLIYFESEIPSNWRPTEPPRG